MTEARLVRSGLAAGALALASLALAAPAAFGANLSISGDDTINYDSNGGGHTMSVSFDADLVFTASGTASDEIDVASSDTDVCSGDDTLIVTCSETGITDIDIDGSNSGEDTLTVEPTV